MAIPDNITSEDILQTLHEIDEKGIPTNREPKGFYFLFQNKAYPPKYTISLANKLKNGDELPSIEFSGGDESNNFLRDRGFAIVKIAPLEKAIAQLKEIYNNSDPESDLSKIIKSEKEVYSKYHSLFLPSNIPHITHEEISEFLSIKNNHLWGLHRSKSSIIENFDSVKKGFSALLDENIPIVERLNHIELNKKESGLSGIGPAILTAILHFSNPEKYGVWNSSSENALKEYDIYPLLKRGVTFGEKYTLFNEVFSYVAKEVGVSLWVLEPLWFRKLTDGSSTIFSPEEFLILLSDLKKFIPQSHTNDLTTKNYLESFGRFQVTKSFGQGTPARVTWISLTESNESINQPKKFFVSFYYDKSEKLFLVLGITEDINEVYDWPLDIQEKYPRFIDSNVSEIIAKRYPNSRIFSEYHINLNNIDESLESQKGELETDLADILRLYIQTLQSIQSQSPKKVNYWRIAPGRNGVLWDTWREEKICSIGYYEYKPYFEELLQISDKNSFNLKLVDIAKNNSGTVDFSFMLSSQPYFHQNTIWSFYHEMKPGDIVIASTGKSRIYGIGTIMSGISTRDSEHYAHIRDVRWDYQDLNIPIPSEVTGNFTITLNKLTSEDYDKIMAAIQKKSQEGKPDEEIETDPILNLLKRKGQVILYGPPGTGKTYHVQELINKQRSQIQKISTREYPSIFWTYLDQRNFSDFSKIDINSVYTYQWTEGWNYQIYFDKISPGDILVCYGWNEHKIVGIAKCISKERVSFQYQFILLTDGPTYSTLRDDPIFSTSKIIRTRANARITLMDYPIFQQILTLAGQAADSVPIESYEREEEVNTTEFITFHQSFSYEEFIEGLRPTTEDGCISYSVKEGIFKEFCRRAYNTLLSGAGIKKTWEDEQDVPFLTDEEAESVVSISAKYPFYLVIDEINRGDISRIFGELITLLEKDKRLLASHQITTKLPSSRTLFGIPPNLFVIGTMNTADKSIALIDIALRRRFGFIELLPDYELLARELTSDDRNVQEVFQTAISLLQTINIRILHEHDREHQIGHSFLLKLKGIENRDKAIYELSLIWYHEIIPLLHEYFYDSPKKLFKVIGPEFMKPDLKSITFTPMKEGESFLVACAKVTKDPNFNAQSTTNAL